VTILAMASDSHPAEPELLVGSVIDALEGGRWEEVLGRIDPRELAQWRRTLLSALRFQASELPGEAGPLAGWGAASIEELEALAPGELFARWLQAFSPGARLRGELGSKAPFPPPIERSVLGSVAEGDDVAHVVYRERTGSRHGNVRVATVRRRGSEWLLSIDYELLGYTAWNFGPPRAAEGGQHP
jgi:hypothetical protein